MKNSIKNSCLLALILAVGLFAAAFPAAGTQLPILTIDESNPNLITITGTGYTANQPDGTTVANAGVDLMNFFISADDTKTKNYISTYNMF